MCVFFLRIGREIAEHCEAILSGQLVIYSQGRSKETEEDFFFLKVKIKGCDNSLYFLARG